MVTVCRLIYALPGGKTAPAVTILHDQQAIYSDWVIDITKRDLNCLYPNAKRINAKRMALASRQRNSRHALSLLSQIAIYWLAVRVGCITTGSNFSLIFTRNIAVSIWDRHLMQRLAFYISGNSSVDVNNKETLQSSALLALLWGGSFVDGWVNQI